ncbi:MAG: hypothetical protein KAW92_13085 [Candidatus Cloacimonetes bacterium]|nr:hypothetical protein [Candidatus Cloacimonadota bacterium]MCK4359645.1 hypothetical protein [Candidatus Cloacimonadota bacterium]
MIDLDYIKKRYYKLKKKNEGYDFIGKIFKEIEERYKSEAEKRGKNPQQSWNSWSGKALQNLITELLKEHIISSEYKVNLTSDDALRRKKLSKELDQVRRNIEVFYSKYSIVPDADIIVYSELDFKVICVFSCKASLRERVAQAAYWKIKLTQSDGTKNIFYYLVSTDKDKDFEIKKGELSRNRIIVEEGELDGAYILREIPESSRVKNFSNIFNDLNRIFEEWFDINK